MTLETWAIFLPAAFALTLYPGPNNLLAMTHGARYGFGTAMLASSGRFPAFGSFVLGAAVGLGTILAASAELFTVLKLVGAVYLLYLGIRMMMSGAADLKVEDGTVPRAVLVRREFLTAITNPKAMLVFTAFFAPFVDPASPAFGQILLLGGVALVLEVIAVAVYAFAGARIGRFTKSPRGLTLVNRLSGGALVMAGVMLAFARRPALGST
ncbi:LysE family translocator [Chthonobacter albigriseus]|uniref:LysE family translocator n=1 Tax=Chthonobacter albigriseus TaxID=1683161 RepID=UPI0015EF5222|nr:LysE family translocator [Chthonobacter albigriseus]